LVVLAVAVVVTVAREMAAAVVVVLAVAVAVAVEVAVEVVVAGMTPLVHLSPQNVLLFDQISQQEVIFIEEFNHWHRNPPSAIVPHQTRKNDTQCSGI
jgi:hypothetical protein